MWRAFIGLGATLGVVLTLLSVPPPPQAAAVTDETPAFVINQNDLEFILRQIQVSEAHAADELDPSNYELLCTDQNDPAQNCVSDEMRPRGVRTVDGSYNNLRVGQYGFGSADHVFPRLLEPVWRQAEPEAVDLNFEPNEPGTSAMCDAGLTCYGQTEGNVFDSQPREISNLIVDQTMANPAIRVQVEEGDAIVLPGTGVPGQERVVIPNTAPDEELSAPFNTFLGFFGQFFDHGLDLVSKGGNGTLVVPLAEDDSLYCPASGERLNADGEPIACNPDGNFITLSRATRVDDSTEHLNLTSPFIDQNQTYSSHPAHQVFLREYESGANGAPHATGRLIEGVNGGMAKWRDVKAQARNILGILLTDADLLDVPQVVVDPYGNFVPGANGFPQLITAAGFVEGGSPAVAVPADALGTGHAFLDDIAHGSTPVVDAESGELLPRFDEDGNEVLDENGQPVLTGYDNELLDEHFIAGDGRVNENIGLTAVHAVFHAEHNRMVRQIEDLLGGLMPELEAQDSAERGGLAEFAKAFRGEPHAYKSDKPEEELPGYRAAGTPDSALPSGWNADDWSYEERLFQAAKFATEMQYQHLVFEEFARKISPTIDAVVFNENSYNAAINPAITAEFAHVVYRFGHSMMTEEIGREAVVGGQPMSDIPLLTGFLNPLAFDQGGELTAEEATGSLVNGMTRRVGSQIDEHVVDVLRNNLLGQPLDLATLNLLRGRDTGIPSLQEARRTFYQETGDASLRPYISWSDFGLNTKNGDNFGRAGERASLVNFVAAYGTHDWLLDDATPEEKRATAALLVNGSPLGEEFTTRLAGPDRFQTARAIALRHFDSPVPVAYIAPGANFPDALAGGPLAAATGGPILLAAAGDSGEVPLATALALAALNPERIVLLGGPAVIGPNAMAAYQTIAPTTRIAGANRFETAAAVAAHMPQGRPVFIANGMNFPDALAGAAVAAANGAAILLVTPNSLPAATAAALTALNPSEIVILGQTAAVSPAVAQQLRFYTNGPVTRVGGADRYETAMAIAQRYYPNGADSLYLATGANFPDALAATPGAGIARGPMLLVPPSGLTPQLREYIDASGASKIYILGGPVVVGGEVELTLAQFAPGPVPVPDDRVDFMNSTGAWADRETGLDDVDFWVGGLAERLDPFGGMLGSTFNYVFERQLEALQFGDRFYYLFRNEGEQLFAALEGNTFSDMIQRNTDASHLPADIFAFHDDVVDIVEISADPSSAPAQLSLIGGQWRWVGDEHVEMHGTPGDDNLRGDEGDDSIWGYAGNDRIEGGSGNDSLVGGPGDDIITDSFGDDNIKGMQGNDYIHVGPGDDLAIGGLGDDFLVNGGGDFSTFFAGMGDDILLGTSGRMTVIGGEHDDWIEGSGHADLLQGDNADQFQNDTLGGNDVVIGRLGNDDVEGEGGDDIIVGAAVGTDRNHGGNGFDWMTYYGQTVGVTSDWAYNRFFEPNNPLPSRFDFLEALSGGAGNDILRGPISEPDDLSPSEIVLQQATEATLDLVDGFREMVRPAGVGDFSLPFMRGAPEADADGVHMVIIGGPGSDTIEGRGGNDFLHGDAMLRVRLTDGTNFYDSAAQLQPLVARGEVNPGDIDIVRDIVYDTDPLAVDTAVYAGDFAEYAITRLGTEATGYYWRIEHIQVDEPEESNGVDIIRGFEKLQFSDGCATLSEDETEWEACLPSAAVTMDPMDPVEDSPVTASLWMPGEEGTTPFDTSVVTNLRYTWWAGEGDSPSTITEWEQIPPSTAGGASPQYIPDYNVIDQYLRVTVSYTDVDGMFRSATSAVSTSPVAAGPNHPPTGTAVLSVSPIVPGTQFTTALPQDADGLEEAEPNDQLAAFDFQWSWTTAADPADPGAIWTDVAGATSNTFTVPDDPAELGRWYRVTVTYTDLGGTTESPVAYASGPVTAPAP